MQRRARIKAVANLSNVRRGTSKSGAEIPQENESSKKDDIKHQLNDIEEKTSSENDQINTESAKTDVVIQATSSNSIDNDDDVNKRNSLLDKLNEKSSKSDNIDKTASQDDVPSSLEVEKDVLIKQESFKTPVQITPRAENESSSSSKFRKPKKIAPRLNIARAVSKVQDVDEKPKSNDVIVENLILSPVHSEKAPESPINVFSPPSTPFSPPPNRPRPETPREITDSPGFIINHNLHHPPTPQSPFYPASHSRIRTESLCSIKSTTVANLQPRKKVRTEDQKILDNKRESRERLSNKKIEKSQLRMFDMIYYNPTTNPMKPRATPTAKEKSPKKIDLTMDLPPSPSPPKEASNAIAVPQLKLNADGELVLDEASLVVENEEQKKNRILLANTNVVYHDELSGTYGYYKRQQRTREWPQEETIKFYRCLNTVGTDFSLMLNLFPNRSRRDLKLKFKKEEKNNPHLVDKALLNHNTFDIEELQRELDEEDEIRRKEAESKSSEVKELVKRKILKKQEAKAKARQQDKAKIEKILSDGDLVLNSVDNQAQEIKENMEKSGDSAAPKRKRAPKRKNIQPEPSMEFKKIMLHARINESISVNELKTQKSLHIMETETSIIPKEQSETKSAIVFKEMSSSTIVMKESARSIVPYEPNMSSASSFDSIQPETSTLSIVAKIEKESSSTIIDKLISDLPKDAQLDIDNQDSLLSKTGRFISDLITDSYRDTQENENDYLMEEEEEDIINVKKEESTQKHAVQESLLEPVESNEFKLDDIQVTPTSSSLQSEASSDISMETVVEQPILTEPEPSYDEPIESVNPSMLSAEPSYSPSVICMEPSYNPSIIPAEHSYDLSCMSRETSNCPSILTVQESDDLMSARISNNQAISIESDTEEMELDDESFLNSLDLERLVIVVKQINGKDFYDIHETDGDTQNLSDKPLNLPRHIVDLIVSAMTQDD